MLVFRTGEREKKMQMKTYMIRYSFRAINEAVTYRAATCLIDAVIDFIYQMQLEFGESEFNHEHILSVHLSAIQLPKKEGEHNGA